MTALPGAVIVEDGRYVLRSVDGRSAISFRWKRVTELSVPEYMDAIRVIARACLVYRPELVLIDVRHLAVAVRFDEEWWATEILPIYHEAGVAGFAHITGSPDAADEQADTPAGVHFKMGQFTDLRTALEWKGVVGLSVLDDRAAIGSFANLCQTHQPALAVIDVTQLENQQMAEDTDLEDFARWWTREIVPTYHAAGIAGLAIVIGDPNAPGETSEVPPGVNFRMGYFTDRQSALGWNLS